MAFVGFGCPANGTVGRFRIGIKGRERKVDFTRLPSIQSFLVKGMNRKLKVSEFPRYKSRRVRRCSNFRFHAGVPAKQFGPKSSMHK